jgi:competence protein ComEC
LTREETVKATGAQVEKAAWKGGCSQDWPPHKAAWYYFAMKSLWTAMLVLACAAALQAAKSLEIFSIDVEGGQATLFVSPSGESMLVDTGWAGFNQRDADRIVAAAKLGGVKKIDYLVITHFHADHVGGVQQLAGKMPIVNFVDHGPNSETDKGSVVRFNEYSAFRDKGKHILAKPGDTIPIKGLDVKVLSSNGDLIQSPLPGAGQPNAACEGFAQPAADTSENSHSVGMLITFGSFRMIDMGDLTKDKDYQLACPVNKIGAVDVYLVSHHGLDQSSSMPFVRALHPRVAIMNNGARKGGSPLVFQTLHESPGLVDLWQIHYAIAAGKENNSNDSFLANVEEVCEGKWIKLTAEKDGSFKVFNSRNKFEKAYPKK